jgi:hypothetical protein
MRATTSARHLGAVSHSGRTATEALNRFGEGGTRLLPRGFTGLSNRMQVRTMAKKGGKKKGGGGGKGNTAGESAEDAAAAAAAAEAAGARLQLLERVEVETEIKKSRFVATAAPVTTPQEAMRFFSEAGDPGASHNCFAYKIGRGGCTAVASSCDP